MWVKSELSNEHCEYVYEKDSDSALASQSLA